MNIPAFINTSGLGKVVFPAEEIRQKVAETAIQISRDYAGEELIVIGILKGSFYFVADLTRQLTIPLNIDFLSIGVRSDETNQSGIVSFKKDLDLCITGRHVLLVEDIIGTGLTLAYICQHLESAQPASLKICTLLDNPAERLVNINIAYRCFMMPAVFLVGYGLDYKEKYRNLPDLVEYRQNSRREKDK